MTISHSGLLFGRHPVDTVGQVSHMLRARSLKSCKC